MNTTHRAWLRCALLCAALLAAPTAAHAVTTINVTTTSYLSPGGLYQAVQTANATSDPTGTNIVFNIPPSMAYHGLFYIPIPVGGSGLLITAPKVTIDGSTQPGYTGAHPVILFSGKGVNVLDAITISNTSSTTIRALAIFNFRGAAIRAQNSTLVKVAGSYIGLYPVTLGGDVYQQDGIILDHTTGSFIGENTANGGNMLGYINTAAIKLINGSSFNNIFNNYIGTDPAHDNLRVMGPGVHIDSGSSYNRVGGTGPYEGNHISFCGSGITVGPNQGGGAFPVGNQLRNNHLRDNNGMGIDLWRLFYQGYPDDNDPSPDADTGPNGQQNRPNITGILPFGNGTLLLVSLVSAPNEDYIIDLYTVAGANLSGYYEANSLVQAITVHTDSAGNAFGSIVLPGWSTGQTFTAIATRVSTQDSSEIGTFLFP